MIFLTLQVFSLEEPYIYKFTDKIIVYCKVLDLLQSTVNIGF